MKFVMIARNADECILMIINSKVGAYASVRLFD